MTDEQVLRPGPGRATRKVRLVLVAAAVALMVGGGVVVLARSSSGGKTSPYTAQPTKAGVYYADSAPVSGGPALYKLDTGDPVAFRNGETLKVGDLDVTVFVSPYPPPRAANLDFGISRDGVPLEDIYVTLQYDMTTMSHGPFQLLAIPAGAGHYVVPVEFEMEGDFYLNVAVDDGAKESVLNLGVRARR